MSDEAEKDEYSENEEDDEEKIELSENPSTGFSTALNTLLSKDKKDPVLPGISEVDILIKEDTKKKRL